MFKKCMFGNSKLHVILMDNIVVSVHISSQNSNTLYFLPTATCHLPVVFQDGYFLEATSGGSRKSLH
jgi:hypothetical protein